MLNKRGMTGLQQTKKREDRFDRIEKAIGLRNKGYTKQRIAKEMGLSVDTIEKYLTMEKDLNEHRSKQPKEVPAERNCLGCGARMKPRSFGNFMCGLCHEFSRGAMV